MIAATKATDTVFTIGILAVGILLAVLVCLFDELSLELLLGSVVIPTAGIFALLSFLFHCPKCRKPAYALHWGPTKFCRNCGKRASQFSGKFRRCLECAPSTKGCYCVYCGERLFVPNQT